MRSARPTRSDVRENGSARRSGRPVGDRSEDIARSILRATLDELGARGYAGLRIEEVAARAEVNKTSVYRRWPSRKELVGAALVAFRNPDAPAPDTGSLRSDLVLCLRALATRMESAHGAAVVRAIVTADDEELNELARACAGQPRAVPASVLDAGIARGELAEGVDRDLLVELVTAPVYYHSALRRERVEDSFLARVVDGALAGFRSPA